MLNIIGTGTVILIAICGVLVWFAIRAWRIKSRFLKWSTVCLAGLSAAAIAAVSALAVVGLIRLHVRTAPVPDLKVAGSLEQIQRGQAIANSFCGSCHTRTGVLTGGADIGEDLPIPLGSFVSSNLTPAGQLNHWSDGEIFRAIRNGIDADGHWLIIMSYTNAGRLSDDDIQALIAYIRSQPAAGQETANPPDQINFLGIVMLGAGLLPGGKPVFTGVITAPPKGPTARYGEYIVSYQDCRECHGANLTGGVEGQLPPVGPGLNFVTNWSLNDFIATMRTGIDPLGHELSEKMPWRPIGKMDDEELGAIYEYLIRIPELQNVAVNKK
jgi:mono/diheme cytochrome c family protein